MPSFEDLGLREELLQALQDSDLEQPTALQEATIPVLRRGGNLVARASTGAGKTLAYLLGVLDRLEPVEAEAETGAVALRVLVLAPTQDEALRTAMNAYPFLQATGLALSVTGGAWGTAVGEAEVLIAPVTEAMGAVRASALKLDALETVVIDGASTIHELGDWDTVDALLDLVPRDAQRVVISPAFPPAVDDLIDRRVKRALRYPPEAAVQDGPPAPTGGRVGYVLVPVGEKIGVLARQLAQREPGSEPPVIFCRTDERAADLAEVLSIRGFLVGSQDDPDTDAVVAAAGSGRAEIAEDTGEEPGQTISYDVPADAAQLLARHTGDDAAVVMLEPRELPHLREIARLANRAARPVPLPLGPGSPVSHLPAFREEIRRAIREEDLAAQMLVLEPLFEEFTAPEIAAAASALLRQRRPQQATTTTIPTATPGTRAPSAGPTGPQTGPPPATWARLYVGVGSRDEIRPGDLVGAIAGEADIPGGKIGKIEIRDSFSIVEVQAEVAELVIRKVNGTTVKGRSVRVDYDRGGDRGRSGGPPRRQGDRPDTGGGRGRVVRRPTDRS